MPTSDEVRSAMAELGETQDRLLAEMQLVQEKMTALAGQIDAQTDSDGSVQPDADEEPEGSDPAANAVQDHVGPGPIFADPAHFQHPAPPASYPAPPGVPSGYGGPPPGFAYRGQAPTSGPPGPPGRPPMSGPPGRPPMSGPPGPAPMSGRGALGSPRPDPWQGQTLPPPRLQPPGALPSAPVIGFDSMGRPVTQSVPERRWYQGSGVVGKLLAIGGVAVVLIGVMFLLVLAAQAGLFGPIPRTVGAALLAIAMGVFAVKLRAQQTSNVAAVALAGGAMGTAILDVTACTLLYEWFPLWVGLVLCGLIGLAGLWAARAWNSQPLAATTLAATILLSVPIGILQPSALMAFLIVINAVALYIEWPVTWPAATLARGVPTFMVAISLAVSISIRSATPVELTLMWVATGALVAMSVAAAVHWSLRAERHRESQPLPGGAFPSPSGPARAPEPKGLALLVWVSAVLAALSSWPMLVYAGQVGKTATLIASGLLAVTFVSLQALRRLGTPLRLMGGIAGLIALLTFLFTAFPDRHMETGILVLALAQLLVSVISGDRISFWLGFGASAVGALGMFVPLFAQLSSSWAIEEFTGWTTLNAALLLVAMVSAYLTARRRSLLARQPAAILLAVFGLLVISLLLVSGAINLFRLTGWGAGAITGFRVGHAATTVLAISIAMVLVHRGLKRRDDVDRRVGLIVAGMAVAKLFLVDLLALNGIARVIAFIVVGLALIVLGMWYARAYEQARRAAEAAQPPVPDAWVGPPPAGTTGYWPPPPAGFPSDASGFSPLQPGSPAFPPPDR